MPFFSTEVDRKLFPWRKWMTEKEPMCQPDQHILYTCYVFNSHPQCHLWFYQEQEAAFSPWNRNQLQSHGCKLYTHHIHIQNQASLLLIPWLWLKKLSLDVSRTIYICSMARQLKEWSKCRLRQSLRTWWSHIRSKSMLSDSYWMTWMPFPPSQRIFGMFLTYTCSGLSVLSHFFKKSSEQSHLTGFPSKLNTIFGLSSSFFSRSSSNFPIRLSWK